MAYLERLVDAELQRVTSRFPCVVVLGPRACGKTTSAERLAASITRLDRPPVANVFRADPDVALATRAEPALLDEWQDVPEVLGAVKRAVDSASRPGRFILTGSVSAGLDATAWPGTGRVIRLPMAPMTQREKHARVANRPSMTDVLAGRLSLPAEVPTLIDYVEMALISGFPEAISLDDPRDQRTWLNSYVEQLVTRDAGRVVEGRDAAKLRSYLQAWALNSAGIVDDTTIYDSIGLNRRTHIAYEQLLTSLFVAELIPAWTSNRLKRLALAPKRYITDTGLMAAAARIGRADIMESADLLGRVIDTFVFNELRAHLAFDEAPSTLHHIRTQGGREEVDLVIEFDGGRVIGIEIKATASPDRSDGKHLFWLRDQLGDRFTGGVVFHTGPEVIDFGDRVVALPICALWGAR